MPRSPSLSRYSQSTPSWGETCRLSYGSWPSFCLVFDELGYHRGLAASERRVHVISWLALLLFVGIWLWTEQTG